MFLSRTSVSTTDGAMLVRTHDDSDGFATKAASMMSQRGDRFDTMPETAEATEGSGRCARSFEIGGSRLHRVLTVLMEIVAIGSLAVTSSHRRSLLKGTGLELEQGRWRHHFPFTCCYLPLIIRRLVMKIRNKQ